LLGVTLVVVAATALANSAGGASRVRTPFWTRCSLHVKVANVEVSPVEVKQIPCVQARRAIQRASILLTPGGPIFSTRGYSCRSTNILPPVDPSPIQLPAAEHCAGAKHSHLSFIWNYAS
jgi:hypothetical protein